MPTLTENATLVPKRPLDKETVLQRIEQALAQGCTRLTACAIGGISRETFYQWCRDSVDITDRLRNAEYSAAGQVEQVFTNAALSGNDWRASEAWLKRRMPEQWGDKLEIGKLDTHDLLRVLQSQESPDTALDAEFTALDAE